MTLLPLYYGLLALLVIGVAWWTLVARETMAAVIGFIAYGMLLGLVWAGIASVDVALTEAAIGGGVTGVLLLRAAARLRPTEPAPHEKPGLVFRVLVGIFCAIVTIGLAVVVLFPTDPAPSLAIAAAEHLPALELGNPVTAVLIAYRALDTMLEKVVLLLALIGVWSLGPDRNWGGLPGRAPAVVTDSALTFLAKLLPPIGIVFGVYLLWTSADNPGGAFQGGTVLAAMWILAMMAGLRAPPAIGSRALRLLLLSGTITFIVVGFAGFLIAGGFLSYPAAFPKALILLIEIPMTLTIAVTLGLLVSGPAERDKTS
ncbi:DUF4040 domain-containing protein [Kaistia dalseonensis]|uniref:Multisubunit Na+/H+ antiporter MnhB subunit n=1 Tax=Kaistia dalseonensis TaxID=410840 RepID=A0ABU0H813_9HYPH|nr:MnhB domain-containing protein [Kaistia dalseonensis]MCX5495851.1 DUF4040 domain-containing protein [Kaistia dalseonensis]MDQ0438452.1 multisubunit Na+/H+ antiporter MnhB subunit [Kaistia dalseonensis]